VTLSSDDMLERQMGVMKDESLEKMMGCPNTCSSGVVLGTCEGLEGGTGINVLEQIRRRDQQFEYLFSL